MKTRRLWTFALLIGLGATSCAEEVEEPLYESVPVGRRDIAVSASAAGGVEAIQTIEIKSKASGEIVQVAVDVGDEVVRGQILVRVDPRVPSNALVQAEADLVVAEANLANAEARFRRAQALFESQSITQEEWENARLTQANANAQLIRAQRVLEDARISFADTDVRAAMKGIILTRQVEVGNVIQSASGGLSGGQVLMTMADLDSVQVRSLVDETDIGTIIPGQRVSIRVDAYPNRPFEGRVLKVEPAAQVEQNVTMFPVLVRLANANGLLRVGMSVEVEVHIGERRGVVVVPNVALRTERDVTSMAAVLGFTADDVMARIEAARPGKNGEDASPSGQRLAAGATDARASIPVGRTITFRGQELTVPDSLDFDRVRAVVTAMETAGPEGMGSGTDEDRRLIFAVMQANGMGFGALVGTAGRTGATGERGAQGPGVNGSERNQRPAGQPRPARVPDAPRPVAVDPTLIEAWRIVFVQRNGRPEPVWVKTGLTDQDYSEVLDGLVEGDTLVMLRGR